jgi:hypothetical protein
MFQVLVSIVVRDIPDRQAEYISMVTFYVYLYNYNYRWGELIFSIYIILPAALGSRVHSASNRNEYQMHKNNFRRSKERLVRRAEQPYRHLWTDCLDNVGFLTSHNPIGLRGMLRG